MEYHLLICYSFKALLGCVDAKPVRPASFIGRVNCWTPDNEYHQKEAESIEDSLVVEDGITE